MSSVVLRSARCPVAIGGVGGSGTRVVARILGGAGLYIGSNLNLADDNLDFPGLDRFAPWNAARVAPRLEKAEIEQFRAMMEQQFVAAGQSKLKWGWKLPPTFLFLEQFCDHFPHLAYVHVIRHGLDMAFSENKNQVRKWGHIFGVTDCDVEAPESALEYWVRANDYTIDLGKCLLGERFFLLRFEELFSTPKQTVEKLLSWAGLPNGESVRQELSALIRPQGSVGRYKRQRHKARFSDEQISSVRRLGYAV